MKPPVWGLQDAVHPPLRGTHQADLCVVGLGGSGLAAIAAGINAGMTVVGIDADRIAAGAAGRNGGFLLAGPAQFHHRARGAFGADAATRLYARTLDEIGRMDEASSSVRVVGSLRIAADDEEQEDIARHIEALHEDGFPAAPYIGPEGDGMLVPGDGVFDPADWCRQLSFDVLGRGASLHEQSRAIEMGSGWVETLDGGVRCSHVVVAVDGGLEELFPALVGRVETWRLQMLATPPIDRVVTPRAVYRRFGLDYWQQLPDGRIALGGGRDVGGESELGAPYGTSPRVQEYLDGVLRDDVGVTISAALRWSGRVAHTDDGLPVCEEVVPGVTAFGAYSGTGNVIGAICGAEVIARISGQEAPFLDLLDEMRTLDRTNPEV